MQFLGFCFRAPIVQRALAFIVFTLVGSISVAQSISPTNSDFDALYEEAQAAMSAGDRVRAVSLLERVIQINPQSAGALLDLALLHCELGEAGAADQRFSELEQRYTLPESIRSLIQFRRQMGCLAQPKQANYQFQAQLTRGLVSNVNAAPLSSIVQIGSGERAIFLELTERNRPTADRFSAFGFQSIGPVASDENAKWLVFVDSRQYETRSDLNLTNLILGYAKPAPLSFGMLDDVNWSASLGRVLLGERGFERSYRLAADAWSLKQQTLNHSTNRARWGLGSAVSLNRYDQDSRFNSQRIELLARAEVLPFRSFGISGYGGPILDLSTDGRPGGDRRGAVLGAELNWALPVGRAIFSSQAQTLTDADVFNEVFFPGVERLNRRFFSTLRYEAALPELHPRLPRLVLFGQGARERSIDRLSIFSFKNQILMFGIRGVW